MRENTTLDNNMPSTKSKLYEAAMWFAKSVEDLDRLEHPEYEDVTREQTRRRKADIVLARNHKDEMFAQLVHAGKDANDEGYRCGFCGCANP